MTEEEEITFGGNEKGLTLEQTWRLNSAIFGKMPVCLLAAGRPSVPIAAIKHVVKMNPKQLTNALMDILTLFNENAPLLFHDSKIGHCIVLVGYDSDSSKFIYFDPWPNVSLLFKGYNTAGIDAKKESEGWSITSSELEKVIFASLVYENYWAEYFGEKYYITYEEFKQSGFWSFFNITESQSQLLSDGTLLITLKPGGSQSEIELMVTLNQKKRLINGKLNVKRSWIIGPPYGLNPFGLDFVRSFIVTLTPPPDKERIQNLIEIFNKIENIDYTKKLLSEGSNDSMIIKPLHTYLGISEYFNTSRQFSKISMKNSVLDEISWLQIEISTDAL